MPAADPARERYLQVTLGAMQCSLDLIAGKQVDYLDEVRRIYDIEPSLVDEAEFLGAQAKLDAILPAAAGETLAERLESHRGLFEIDAAQAMPLLDMVRDETRRRTLHMVALPEDESVEVALVNDQTWSAYNWYLGNGRSLIEFNTDIKLSSAALLGTFAHEGYPGHHTEAILKEQSLYRDRGLDEQSVMILHSPAAVIAEGIATTALEIIFPDDSHYDWNLEVLFPAARLSAEAMEAAVLWPTISQALKQSRHVSTNAAILFHTGQLNREQTIDYIRTYDLSSPKRAEQIFRFLSHPLSRSYIFTYTEGYELIDKAADKHSIFNRLLTEQILPSELDELASEGTADE